MLLGSYRGMRGRAPIAVVLGGVLLAAPPAQASHPGCPEWCDGLAAYP